jgi:hypothetical protein
MEGIRKGRKISMESALSGGMHKERQEGMYGSVVSGGRPKHKERQEGMYGKYIK